MRFVKSSVPTLIFLAALTFGIAATTQPAVARNTGNPMAVFDARITELLSELTVIGNASPDGRRSPQYRALVIRVAQMQAFRPNLARLPRDAQWDCISYWVGTYSPGKRDHYGDDDEDEDEDKDKDKDDRKRNS